MLFFEQEEHYENSQEIDEARTKQNSNATKITRTKKNFVESGRQWEKCFATEIKSVRKRNDKNKLESIEVSVKRKEKKIYFGFIQRTRKHETFRRHW